MSAAFLKCARSGGRVRTKKLGKGKYMKLCFKKGHTYVGHVAKKNR